MSDDNSNISLAKHRLAKLVATASLLVIIEVVVIFLLLNVGTTSDDLKLFGFPLQNYWCLGALGGILGGTSRALYAFLVEVRAFEIFRCTGNPPGSMIRLTSGELVEYHFDFMFVWYLYLIKPFIGCGVGFLFALLHEFGLVPFLKKFGSDAYGIVLIGGVAGIFAENALARFRTMFQDNETRKNETTV